MQNPITATGLLCLLGCKDPGDTALLLAALGEACLESIDCGSTLCVDAACAEPCEGESDCGDGDSCMAALPDDGEDPVAACLPSNDGVGFGAACSDDLDCATNLCLEDRCSALCTEDCGSKAVCEEADLKLEGQPLDSGACQVDLGLPDLSLGPFDIDTDFLPAIELEIPEGVVAFTATVVRADDDRWVGVRTLETPDGTLLYDRSVGGVNPASNNYPAASTILVPSTDDPTHAVSSGTYLLSVGTYDLDLKAKDPFIPVVGTIDRVEVHFRYEAGEVYDLNLFLAPETGLKASDEAITDLLAELDSGVLGSITLGELQVLDLAAGYDDITDPDEIRQICRLYSEPGPNRISINAFLVPSISFTSGFTSGNPAPPGLFATSASGIVIEALGNSSDTGLLLAHEIGHFLALPHTTSITLSGSRVDLASWDGITDTPECAEGTEYTSCPDYENLMFPFFPLTSNLALTEGQTQVLSGSASLYNPW